MDKLQLTINSTYKYTALIQTLIDLKYERTDMAVEAGEFTVKGLIIDIFSSNHTHPIRIEFDDEKIERLSTFDSHTQRSLSKIKTTTIFKFNPSDTHTYVESDVLKGDQLLSSIDENDYVVHEIYGIGQYKELIHLTLAGREGEYLFIQYKGTDKLYVPLDQLQYVHKYVGQEKPKLNGLNDGNWKRAKNQTKKIAEELVEDVFQLLKLRKESKGYRFKEDTELQLDMEENFPFTETKDQLSAIEDIKKDMESDIPMDRLLCGDVGFGKTEVIMRAAFKAVENNKQVAVIAPTTILAEQHAKSFLKRMKKYPFKIERLSRFVSKTEQTHTLKELKNGKVDIIIGTHRLLQKDVHFSDLGLLVVDEEHRFGVAHKEAIKKLAPFVDILTVSATPIPRTLYMALTGSKEISNMTTPPFKRKPINTIVAPITDKIIYNAITDELKRKGQVFYLYNNVRQINKKLAILTKLVPKAKIVIAHGQMSESQLMNSMQDFISKKANVLLCSTIIENGVDIPNANTIIIEKGEHFGLSQIHQLRGRVGRTDIQAFAYVLYSNIDSLPEKAHKRLNAIKSYAALGAGYKLALKDLELRGAGSVLGHKQSGQISQVGFELYCKILESTVRKMKNIEATPIRPEIELSHKIKTYIPDTYIQSPKQRLAIYQRIINCNYQYELKEIKEELIDRFGEFPEIVDILFTKINIQLNPNN